MKKRHNAGGTSKIAREMVLRLSIMIAIPVLLTGLRLVKYSCSTLYEQNIQQVDSDVLRVKSILVDCLINATNLSEEVFKNKELRNYLMGVPESAEERTRIEQEVISQFDSIQAKNTFISSMHIYTTNPDVEESFYISRADENIVEECFGKSGVPASIVWGIFPSAGRDKNNPELTMVCTLSVGKTAYPSVLVTTISSNYLRNRIQNNDLTTMLSVDDSRIFFSTIRSLQETEMPVEIDFEQKFFRKEGIFEFDGSKRIGCIAALPVYNANSTIYIYTLNPAAYRQIVTVGLTNALITFGVILVAILGIIGYTFFFSRRIVTLKTAMKRAKDGDYDDIIESLKGDDELTETFEDLKGLIEDIKKKDARMYEAQLREKEFLNEQSKMEFKLLSNQINPHFIYNTLETIRMLALEADDKEAADAAFLLARSMHYVQENTMTHSTSLGKELDYVQVYLRIQQIRFQERLEYRIEVDESIDTAGTRILPFLLQPIVENSVIHGLEKISRAVLITIAVKREAEIMKIHVADNGRGMDEDKLQELEKCLETDERGSGDSIGICNIKSRIRLFYGEPYGMSVRSKAGDGTHITLTLPMQSTTASF